MQVIETRSAEQMLATARSMQPALIVLERKFDGTDALEMCGALRRETSVGTGDVPIIVVTDAPDFQADNSAGVTDWLVMPFSSAYARTRMRAWLLRTACRWERAPSVQDEERRLSTLHGLGILDTPREHRFDRLTRLAAAILDVPVALVSLVDKDRQWFKSAHGLELRETSREVSFCAHAVASAQTLIVPDAFRDPRFADNPLVTGHPRIRFYAGFPLFVAGSCVGTLCAVDKRPRHVDAEALGLLQDLAALVEFELRVPRRR
jgi:GAF domain-containing protein